MKPFHFFFRFTRDQRRGIIALLLLILLLQAGWFAISSLDIASGREKSDEEKKWLAVQSEIDALKSRKEEKADKIYPFNPNFISDYKGYTLGLSVNEIDRVHKFRKSGQFINSAADFKKVTGVSDSLLNKIAPYFKFPDWVKNKKQAYTANTDAHFTGNAKEYIKKEEKINVIDINEALEEDLDKVYGIGPVFAKKILRRRAQLGAFVSMEQMDEFKEFSPEALQGLRRNFKTGSNLQVNKININTASLKQLTYFTYFDKDIARAIITKRSMKGKINAVEDLTEINNFPVDRIKIIALYLEF